MARIAVVTSHSPFSDGGHLVIARGLAEALGAVVEALAPPAAAGIRGVIAGDGEEGAAGQRLASALSWQRTVEKLVVV